MKENIKPTEHFLVMIGRLGYQHPMMVTTDRNHALGYAAEYIHAMKLQGDEAYQVTVYCFVDGELDAKWSADTAALLGLVRAAMESQPPASPPDTSELDW